MKRNSVDILPVVYKIVADTEHSLQLLLGSKVKITFKLADEALTIDEAQTLALQQLVTSELGVSWQTIISRNRKIRVAMARQVYCYLSVHLLGKSLSEIGREIKRDHTTIIAARKRIDDLISVNDVVKDHINKIKQRFYEDFNKA